MEFWAGFWVGVITVLALLAVSKLLLRQIFDRYAQSTSIYGQDQDFLNMHVDSHWFNMGYWTEATSSFAEAGAHLASLVSEKTFQDNDKIVDFGSGNGDQLLLWAACYPKARIYSVTREAFQAQISSEKVRRKRLDQRIHVFHGDAIHPESWVNAHARKGLQEYDFDVATAVDSCYHFVSQISWAASRAEAGLLNVS
ncbi:hypothetical protein HDU67_001258 [Dinochytrium kinnereticum]|nr:hypothetical protein HDU67_001258 [Dinochytrium kinnereticum]